MVVLVGGGTVVVVGWFAVVLVVVEVALAAEVSGVGLEQAVATLAIARTPATVVASCVCLGAIVVLPPLVLMSGRWET